MESYPHTIRGNSIGVKTEADTLGVQLPHRVTLYVCKSCNHREVENDGWQHDP